MGPFFLVAAGAVFRLSVGLGGEILTRRRQHRLVGQEWYEVVCVGLGICSKRFIRFFFAPVGGGQSRTTGHLKRKLFSLVHEGNEGKQMEDCVVCQVNLLVRGGREELFSIKKRLILAINNE